MNTHDIEAFVAVVETGSLVAAAARLRITQSGVSRRMQSLEQALGAPLLDRQSKPPRLTATGREAYELGRRVLQSVEDLRVNVAPGAVPAGELRIGVSSFLSETALVQPVDRLRASFPRVALRVRTGWSTALLDDVNGNALDAAAVIRSADMPLPDGLQVEPLGQHPAQIVAPRELRLPARGATLAELAAHVWIVNQDGCSLRRSLRRAFERERLPFNVAIEAYGTELQLSLVARGLGLALVTRESLARSAFRERVRPIASAELAVVLSSWLVYKAPLARLAAPLACFRDALRAALEHRPRPRESGAER